MKFYFLIIILISFSVQSLNAQGIKGGLAFGGNLSQVDGDEVFGYKKIGFNTSALALIEFNKKWSLSLEANFNQKGAYQKYPYDYQGDTAIPYYNLRLNYAEVPVMMHFTDKGFLTFGLGLSWARLVGVNEIEWGKQTSVTLNSGEFEKNELNGIVDLRVPIVKGLHFNFRFSYSLIPIRERTYTDILGDSWTRKQYNNVLTLRLIYIFNQAPRS
jgi:hypothetical protein